MFEYFNGIVESKKPTEVILDVNGVGYILKISLSSYSALPKQGQKAKILCYFHVREQEQQLFGFYSELERELFLHLLTISGVGPKLALTILSGLNPESFIQAIQIGDVKTLNGISGVGKKTAQRLVVELREKLGKIEVPNVTPLISDHPTPLNSLEQETLLALLSLGYNRHDAEKAIQLAQEQSKSVTVEELLKNALKAV